MTLEWNSAAYYASYPARVLSAGGAIRGLNCGGVDHLGVVARVMLVSSGRWLAHVAGSDTKRA